MAIKRGPDGIPVDTPSIKKTDAEQPTVATRADNNDAPLNIDINIDQPTEKASSSPGQTGPTTAGASGGSLFLDDTPTVPARGTRETRITEEQPKPVLDDQATVIGRGAAPAAPGSTGAPTVAVADDAMSDPIAGWLIVIAGPGKGNALKLGYGQNTIGRSASERVSLDFGDSQISRSNHATVTYDPRGNQFYLQPGSGTNLTYLNQGNTPVLQPVPLPSHSEIVLGDTTLLFIPLCGEQFTWASLEEG